MDLWTPTRRLHVVPPRNNYFFIKNVRIPKTSFSITYFVLANCNCFITCLSRMGKDKGPAWISKCPIEFSLYTSIACSFTGNVIVL
jgi:hypothetical protein